MGIKLPKIIFPYFNGKGPTELLRKAHKYFRIHQLLDDVRIDIVEMI